MTREPISVALFAKLAAVPGLVTSSRILQHFSDVPAVNQPALFLTPGVQTAVRAGAGLPAKWTVDMDVFVYVNRASSDVPDTALNTILDGIEAALLPLPAQEVQTLGGLCTHCWIEGAIQTEVGSMGNQILCVVPIRILVAP